MTAAAPRLTPGFAEPVHDTRSVFRAVLDAMAHPGRVVAVPARPAAVGAAQPAALAVLLALADGETPIWLDPPARRGGLPDYLRFHCGAALVEDGAAARFALVSDPSTAPPLAAFSRGTPDYPDRSTTLVLQVDELGNDGGVRLTGPGIETEARLHAAPLPDGFGDWMAENRAGFPLGVDVVLTADDRLAALPRPVTVEA